MPLVDMHASSTRRIFWWCRHFCTGLAFQGGKGSGQWHPSLSLHVTLYISLHLYMCLSTSLYISTCDSLFCFVCIERFFKHGRQHHNMFWYLELSLTEFPLLWVTICLTISTVGTITIHLHKSYIM